MLFVTKQVGCKQPIPHYDEERTSIQSLVLMEKMLTAATFLIRSAMCEDQQKIVLTEMDNGGG